MYYISEWLLAEVRAAPGQTSARNHLLAQVLSPRNAERVVLGWANFGQERGIPARPGEGVAHLPVTTRTTIVPGVAQDRSPCSMPA